MGLDGGHDRAALQTGRRSSCEDVVVVDGAEGLVLHRLLLSRLLEQFMPLTVRLPPLRRLHLDPSRCRTGDVDGFTPFADDALKSVLQRKPDAGGAGVRVRGLLRKVPQRAGRCVLVELPCETTSRPTTGSTGPSAIPDGAWLSHALVPATIPPAPQFGTLLPPIGAAIPAPSARPAVAILVIPAVESKVTSRA